MNSQSSRRDFLRNTGRVAAVSVLAGVALPQVHAAGDDTIRLAIVGCGSRGTGAVVDALAPANGSVKLVAMADVFKDRLKGSLTNLQKACGKQVDVPPDRQFVGFDAYKNAMACL